MKYSLHKFHVLNIQRLVQSQFQPDCSYRFICGLFSQHQTCRISRYQTDNKKSRQADHKKNRYHLQNSSQYIIYSLQNFTSIILADTASGAFSVKSTYKIREQTTRLLWPPAP